MGNRLSKIYTRTGDSGETGLGDGRRVAKRSPRVEAMGEVDTLNSQLGLLLAELADAQVQWPALDELISVFGPCQHRLFDLGGELAMPDYQALQESEIERLEQAIDRWNQELGPLWEFILPGGSRLIALAHLCRSVTRTAERRCQQLNASETVRPVLLAYLNRLSDALFVAARLIARRQGCGEILWQPAAAAAGAMTEHRVDQQARRRDGLHAAWEAFIVLLVCVNLALILFDSLFALQPVNTALASLVPQLHERYQQSIHANFSTSIWPSSRSSFSTCCSAGRSRCSSAVMRAGTTTRSLTGMTCSAAFHWRGYAGCGYCGLAACSFACSVWA